MCGIFGILSKNGFDINLARRGLSELSHRGPDQEGEWFNKKVYLGHKRLSIIDLSDKARQPMISEDKQVILTVNGEIYNYRELKKSLSPKYKFLSKSDSETLLYGYLEWGIERMLSMLDGMFALAIYDQRIGEIILARDRFGKKPVFFTKTHSSFVYASEIKALFSYDDSLRVFSSEGIKDWLFHRGNNSEHTIYHNISKLSPGHYLKVSEKEMNIIKYYDILDKINSTVINTNDADEILVDLLDKSVKKRLLSDVPVGIQLSGGVDSSLISYFMKKHHKGEIHTFNIGFSDKFDQKFSEEKYARFAAEKLDLTHHQINVSKNDVVKEFRNTVYHFDGMLDIPNGIPIYMLSKEAKPYISVILTGEGADELFGGYTKYKKLESYCNANSSKRLPFIALNLLSSLVQSGKINALAREFYLKNKYSGNHKAILEDSNCYISPETLFNLFGKNRHSLFDSTIDYVKIKDEPFYRQLLLVDHKSYLFFLLERQDRASMGAGIESRLPFLDKDLIEWAINLPKDFLYDDDENKKILKKLSAELFGHEFTYRPKIGFPLPIYRWLEEEDGFKPYVDKIFEKDFLLNQIMDFDYLNKYLNKRSFDNKLLCYSDSERMWLKWFLMVLRSAQDVFKIKDIK